MKTRVVRIQLVAPSDRFAVELPNGAVATRGTSLRKWIDRNKGAIAERPDPFAEGETVTVDLSPYLTSNPDATTLRITYEGVDPPKSVQVAGWLGSSDGGMRFGSSGRTGETSGGRSRVDCRGRFDPRRCLQQRRGQQR